MRLTPRCFAALLLASLPQFAWPQATTTYNQISSGTGFIINRGGDIVTNAHVLSGCQSISLLSEGKEIPAQLLASDREHDLAVIRAPLSGEMAVAPLRFNIRELSIGDTVVVYGFPGVAGVGGQATYKKSTVRALSGPSGEPSLIQLDRVVEHGNSGGPVLDIAGNVIGVVMGIAMTYRTDARGNLSGQPVGQVDVAITLAALQDFLLQNGIRYYQSETGQGGYADGVLARNAGKFIVPVHCLQGQVNR